MINSRNQRVLDSTPLYDAVDTLDTITLIRSAIRGLLKAAGERWVLSCRRYWPAVMSTPATASRRLTGTTSPLGRS